MTSPGTMTAQATLHRAGPYDPATGKQSCTRCGALLLKGAEGIPEGITIEIGPLVMPYTDTVKIKGDVMECAPMTPIADPSTALQMTPQQYLAAYEQAPRTWREVPAIDVWPTTLAVLVDPEAPRVCMYSDVNTASPPCRQPAWFVLEKSEHVSVNLYGCRKHTPLMCIVQQVPKRLVRP